jgi:hypothetical protein
LNQVVEGKAKESIDVATYKPAGSCLHENLLGVNLPIA